MRIIGGKYGGRRLVSFKADHLRPTTDRVKEVIFNKLQWSIEGAKVLDLFSGTGNLSLEALSRGAQSVVSVDSSQKSLGILRKNKSLLKVGDELTAISSDVIKFVKSHQGEFDIILVDPPFTKKMADEVMTELGKSKLFNPDTEVFIESTKQETIGDEYGSLKLESRKSYGDKFLSHYIVS